MKSKKTVFKILVSLVLIVGLFIGYEVYISYHHLTVKSYTIKSERIKNDVKAVLISDLHNSEFGKKNEKLVKKSKSKNQI